MRDVIVAMGGPGPSGIVKYSGILHANNITITGTLEGPACDGGTISASGDISVGGSPYFIRGGSVTAVNISTAGCSSDFNLDGTINCSSVYCGSCDNFSNGSNAQWNVSGMIEVGTCNVFAYAMAGGYVSAPVIVIGSCTTFEADAHVNATTISVGSATLTSRVAAADQVASGTPRWQGGPVGTRGSGVNGSGILGML